MAMRNFLGISNFMIHTLLVSVTKIVCNSTLHAKQNQLSFAFFKNVPGEHSLHGELSFYKIFHNEFYTSKEIMNMFFHE